VDFFLSAPFLTKEKEDDNTRKIKGNAKFVGSSDPKLYNKSRTESERTKLAGDFRLERIETLRQEGNFSEAGEAYYNNYRNRFEKSEFKKRKER